MTKLVPPPTVSPIKKQGDAYLNLQINAQTKVILPMTQAQEVVVIKREKLTPLPNMPPFVLGLLNHRSRVVWVIDLGEFLSLPSLNSDASTYKIAIIQSHHRALGLAIEQVKGVIRIQPEAIQSPIGAVASGIVPYLRGCLFAPPKEIFLVLDPEAILSRQI